MISLPPTPSRTYSLVPSTTAFRSHGAVDRAHPTPFERRRETIDMDRAQVANAGQLQSFVGKPGEEVTIDLDILLDDAGRTDRSAECRRPAQRTGKGDGRSEEHTSELQSLMRISYAVFCLNKQINTTNSTQRPN